MATTTKRANGGLTAAAPKRALVEEPREYSISPATDFQSVLKRARETFYRDPNVIGVDIGQRRVAKHVRPNEYALLVYVQHKLPESALAPAQIIPKDFMGLKTDVIEPLTADAPKSAVDYSAQHHLIHDMSAIDWGRLHELTVSQEAPVVAHAVQVQDFGDICVVEEDGTLIKTAANGQQYTDFVRGYQLFRTLHGADTALSRIVQMVQNAQASKAPAQRLADRAGKYLVFMALGSGLLAFTLWYFFAGAAFLFALTAAVSTVVIACPDALALATPTAITVGVGKGAREGVLFKNATALEGVAGIDTVIFDKTGTLTQGKPALTDLIPAAGIAEQELLRLAASADQPSQHPLAELVVKAGFRHRRRAITRRKLRIRMKDRENFSCMLIPGTGKDPADRNGGS